MAHRSEQVRLGVLQCMKVESESEVFQSCPTLSDPIDIRGGKAHCCSRGRPLARRRGRWGWGGEWQAKNMSNPGLGC